MSQITKQLYLRLPEELHAKIVTTAAENNRSGNNEMLHRLEQSFEEQPVVAEEVVAQIFSTVATKVITDVITGCFTKLEERVAAMLDHPMRHIYSVTIPDDGASEQYVESLAAHLPSSGSYDKLSDMWRGVEYRRFDFPGRPGRASPTGRLGESQPEMQDLPAVSGMQTLVAAFKARSCMCRGGPTGEEDTKAFQEQVLGKPFHSGLPFTGQTWVITGSLETMTRDRAREIIMELGGVVAGSVNHVTNVVLWGPGAGSKKALAEGCGVRLRDERQFIELIRGHGVDMPLPKSPDQAVAEQLS